MFDPIRVDSAPCLRTPSRECSPDGSVSERLRDLLGALAGLEASRPRRGRGARRYRDAEYNYLEASVPELDGLEADICVHEGRVYVRVAR